MPTNPDSSGYHDTRFKEEAKREVLWKTLWRCYFRTRVPKDGCVLDLGSGYGHFINNTTARRRIAIDEWASFGDHIDPGIEAIVGDVSDLSNIEDNAVDYAFASNLFEHLHQDKFAQTLAELRRVLSADGSLTLLQPNYTYAYREYFDDFTHVSVWTHISIVDFLNAHGFEIEEMHPRFLPLTIKSRLPVSPILIEAYLRSPIKPMGKQMLVVAKPI